MVWESNQRKPKTPQPKKKRNCTTLSHSLVFIFRASFFSASGTDIKWPFFPDEKNRVFSGETMVLVYHMLHLNAVRQLWSLSVPGCGPAPRRSLLLVGKCFQREQEEATFHGATSRCRTQRMRSVCVCVFGACVYFSMWMSLLDYVCSRAQSLSISLMKEVKRLGFLQVDVMIGPLLLTNLYLQRFFFLLAAKRKKNCVSS